MLCGAEFSRKKGQLPGMILADVLHAPRMVGPITVEPRYKDLILSAVKHPYRKVILIVRLT